MSPVLTIAKEEWRYWLRSQLAVVAMCLMSALLLSAFILTSMQMKHEQHERNHQQTEAEQTFLSQPARHPHRMVHYGHYVFRTPSPLAIFDPGLDPVTGQSIFLEGHRQNSAMFAPSNAQAELGGLAYLTPALIYQLFAPLLLILMGHSAVVREREAKTLAPILGQGVNAVTLLLGKALALSSVVLLLLAPMIPGGVATVLAGESPLAVLSMVSLYFIYLMIWCALTLLASIIFLKRSVVLGALTAFWLGLCLVVPAAGVNLSATLAPQSSKIQTDLVMLKELRKLGDGHNANDPAFVKIREGLLEQYGVTDVADLPVNIGGVVAEFSEAQLANTLNRYAEGRLQIEAKQSNMLHRVGWLSPAISVSSASRTLAGTDLRTHHRFLREAEKTRFSFVQSLNRIHAQKLSYLDDINRSSDVLAEKRTRVSSDNWAVLETFKFEPAAAPQRLAQASFDFWALLIWLYGLSVACLFTARRVKP